MCVCENSRVRLLTLSQAFTLRVMSLLNASSCALAKVSRTRTSQMGIVEGMYVWDLCLCYLFVTYKCFFCTNNITKK